MTRHQSNSSWLLAVICCICLVGVAVIVAQSQSNQAVAQLNTPGLEAANDLSTAFRTVAKNSVRSVVSIVTESKAPETRGPSLDRFFQNDPRFKEFFENNPDFEQMFPGPGNNGGRQRRVQGQGSGFIMNSDGWVVTNTHVVQDADKVTVRLHDGREYLATEVKTDPRSDVAVVKIEADSDLVPLPLGDSDQMEIGDWVLAVGSPFGLEMTVTSGIISAKGRGPRINEREDFLQTDAAINPGNSGGPLVNLRGEAIGINTAISTRSGGYDGVGFAIPMNMAKWIAGQLIENGKVRRAYIGVAIQEVTNAIAEQLGTDVGEGALVSQVMPEGPAGKAGVEPGDLILKLNGQDVDGTRELQGIVERLNVDQSYPLIVQRDGKRKKLDIVLKEMPGDYTLSSAMGVERQDEKEKESENSTTSEELGVDVQELDDELAQQLDLEGQSGVVISSVEPNSLAANAGLSVGDLIEKIGSKKIKNLKDFEAAMKKASLEEGVLILVRSGNATRFVVIQSK